MLSFLDFFFVHRIEQMLQEGTLLSVSNASSLCLPHSQILLLKFWMTHSSFCLSIPYGSLHTSCVNQNCFLFLLTDVFCLNSQSLSPFQESANAQRMKSAHRMLAHLIVVHFSGILTPLVLIASATLQGLQTNPLPLCSFSCFFLVLLSRSVSQPKLPYCSHGEIPSKLVLIIQELHIVLSVRI